MATKRSGPLLFLIAMHQPLNASLSQPVRQRRPLVIVIGMPKSGTESFHEFFTCNEWKSSHYQCHGSMLGPGTKCAECMTRWVIDISRLPVGDREHELRRTCGNYDVFSQVDFTQSHTCMFPQVYYLKTLLSYLPHACFVLNTRPTDHWLSSVQSWAVDEKRGSLMSRMIDACPIHPRNETGLGEWYDMHKARASLALRSASCAIEFNIEEVGLTTHLDRFFKLNSSDRCLAKYAHRTAPTATAETG